LAEKGKRMTHEERMMAEPFIPTVFLIGSNMGDSKVLINRAKEKLGEKFGSIRKESRLYKTEPWGKTDQNWFLNQTVLIDIKKLSPHEILKEVLEIEHEIGRTRQDKWGPRLIDIDILIMFWGVIETPDLVIPHPHLHERRFSLIPLQDVWPNWRHPILNQTIPQMLANCPDKGEVIPIE
jgi:2-amino-4-hydroxy-6-hydroxymethyldihydropteridine diphosphokinase